MKNVPEDSEAQDGATADPVTTTKGFGSSDPGGLLYDDLIVKMPSHDPFDALTKDSKVEVDLDDIRARAASWLTDDDGSRSVLTSHAILSADIRKSTFLMKEASSASRYAQIMTDFINHSKGVIAAHGGWFDKFMGDGFLAYWPCMLYLPDGSRGNPSPLSDLLLSACRDHWNGARLTGPPQMPVRLESAQVYGVASCLHVAEQLIDSFSAEFLPQFRRSTRNFRSDTGLTVGVDVGEVLMVMMGTEAFHCWPSNCWCRADDWRGR